MPDLLRAMAFSFTGFGTKDAKLSSIVHREQRATYDLTIILIFGS
jgi:hypothetical protein